MITVKGKGEGGSKGGTDVAVPRVAGSGRGADDICSVSLYARLYDCIRTLQNRRKQLDPLDSGNPVRRPCPWGVIPHGDTISPWGGLEGDPLHHTLALRCFTPDLPAGIPPDARLRRIL